MRHQPTFRFGALLLYALFAVSALRAQVTWFLPDDRWTFDGLYGWSGIGTEDVRVAPQDTTIDGMIYKKIWRTIQPQNHETYRLVRQEGYQVWARRYGPPNERLLYDFSLGVGDTVLVKGLNGLDYGYIITDIGQIQIGQTQRMTQTVRWLDKSTYPRLTTSLLIEGIGMVQSPMPFIDTWHVQPAYLFLDEPPTSHVDGPDRYFCHFESATGNYTAVVNRCDASPTHTPLEAGLDIYPNPSAGTLYIGGQFGEKTLLISLYDLTGRLVLAQPCTGTGCVYTDFKGLAVLQITCEGQKLFKKIAFVP